MNTPRLPPRVVPTLTEVIDPNRPGPAEPPAAASLPPTVAPVVPPLHASPWAEVPLRPAVGPGAAPARGLAPPAAPLAAASDTIDEATLVRRVLGDLERQLDAAFEQRLRESLTPAIARLAEAMVHEAAAEVAAGLSELVQRAVQQELARLRGR